MFGGCHGRPYSSQQGLPWENKRLQKISMHLPHTRYEYVLPLIRLKNSQVNIKTKKCRYKIKKTNSRRVTTRGFIGTNTHFVYSSFFLKYRDKDFG